MSGKHADWDSARDDGKRSSNTGGSRSSRGDRRIAAGRQSHGRKPGETKDTSPTEELDSTPESADRTNKSSRPKETAARRYGGRPRYEEDAESVTTERDRDDAIARLKTEVNISRLTRLLRRDDDPEMVVLVFAQIESALKRTDNAKHVRPRFTELCGALLAETKRLLSSGYDVVDRCARCLGRVAVSVDEDLPKFLRFIREKMQSETRQAVRQSCLKSFHELTKLETKWPQLPPRLYPDLVVKELKTYLDEADSLSTLVPIVDAFTVLASTHPHVVQPQFEDIVDILIGWHIDVSQGEEVISYVSNALMAFSSLWSSNPDFSFHIISEFLDDLAHFTSRVQGTLPEKTRKPAETPDDNLLAKVISLVRVFSTVVRCLDPGENRANFDHGTGFVQMCVKRVVNVAVACLDRFERQREAELVNATNECLTVLLPVRDLDAETVSEVRPFFEKIFLAGGVCDRLDPDAIQLCLTTLHVLLRRSRASLLDDFLAHLVAPDSLLLAFRYESSPEVQASAQALFRSLMMVKNVTLLSSVYAILLRDLSSAYRRLAPDVELGLDQYLADGGSSEEAMNADATSVALLVFSTLSEIAMEKHSILGMWGLKPPIFQLLCSELNPKGILQGDVAFVNSPVFVGHMYLLFSHCSRHGQFASTSTLLSQPTTEKKTTTDSFTVPSAFDSSGLSSGMGASTAGHFEAIVDLLAELMKRARDPSLVPVLATFSLHWAGDIFKVYGKENDARAARSEAGKTHSHPQEVMAIVSACLKLCSHNDSDICVAAAKNTGIAIECGLLSIEAEGLEGQPLDLWKQLYEVCCYQMGKFDEDARREFSGLFAKIPLFFIYRASRPASFGDQMKVGTMIDVRHGLVSNPQENGEKWLMSSLRRTLARLNIPALPQGTPSFHSHHFKYIVSVILSPLSILTPCMLEDLIGMGKSIFLSCERRDVNENGTLAKPVGESVIELNAMADHGFALFHWLAWHTAQYCVMTKLRTPFGKPQETFASIESSIRILSQSFNAPTDEDEEIEDVGGWDWALGEEENEDSADPHLKSIRSSAEKLVKARLVINFMDALEKLMYNAGAGTSHALQGPPKTVQVFFRTNRGTCEEWMNRIRLPIISMCLKAGLPAAAVYHIGVLLRDGRPARGLSAADVDSVVCLAAEAFIRLGSSTGVVGLEAWAKNVCPQHEKWLEGARLHAAGNYEGAAEVYLETLLLAADDENEEAHLDATTGAFVSSMLDETYMAVGSWDEASAWMNQRDEVLRQDEDRLDFFDENHISLRDLPFCHGMAHVDAGYWQDAESHFKSSAGQASDSFSADELVRTAKLSIFAGLSVAANKSYGTNWKDEAEKFAKRARAALNGLTIADTWTNWPLSTGHGGPFSASTSLPMLKILTECLEDTSSFEKRSCSQKKFFGKSPTEVKDAALIKTMVSYSALIHSFECDEERRQKWWACSCSESLILDAVRVSRDTGNYNLCGKLLYALGGEDEGIENPLIFNGGGDDHEDAFGRSPAALSLKLARTVVEGIDLQYRQGSIDRPMAVTLMATSVRGLAGKLTSLPITSVEPTRSHIEAYRELCSESLSKLCHWATFATNLSAGQRATMLSVDRGHPVVSALKDLRDQLVHGASGSLFDDGFPGGLKRVVFSSDEGQLRSLVGQLLHLGAIAMSPENHSQWNAFAEWAYQVGGDALTALRADPSSIVEDERAALDRLFPPLSTESRAERVKIEAILARHWANAVKAGTVSLSPSGTALDADCNEPDITAEHMDEADGRENLRAELVQHCPWLVTPNRKELLEQVLNIAEQGVSRAFSFHAACAEAYFRCLTLCHPSTFSSSSMREMADAKATLRILSLTVRHSGHMKEVLGSGFASTPTAPWKAIIPQLFASLSNPNPLVRKWLSDLVCCLAGDFPHLIVFPAVVGASCTSLPGRGDKRSKDIWDNYDASEQPTRNDEESNVPAVSPTTEPAAVVEDEEEYEVGSSGDKSKSKILAEENDDDAASDVLVNTCYVALLDTLAKTNRDHVMEVETLVRELRRITLLWDEAWLGSVLHNLPYLSRRLTQLEAEVRKLQGNQFLSPDEKRAIVRGKFDVLVKPVLFVLEQLHEITSGEAETKHETWFQEKFGAVIEATLHCLRNPKRPERPKDTLNDIVALEQWLQQRGLSDKHRSSSSSALKLPDISPTLAALKDTMIAIPGNINAKRGKHDCVTIAGFETVVQILPTKTRPKKLVVQGSDGKKYPFLFKGLEDLHLDERIMQFLKVVNNMLAAERGPDDLQYEARHYSVTPLGPRGGLIEWVDGATPMFSLYKRWQQREVAAVANAATAQTSNQTGRTEQQGTVAAAPRPSDLFYRKLAPLLKEKDIKLENRKNWPMSVVRQVLAQLMAETPKELFARELWAYNLTPSSWWLTNQMYCASTAVMSMVGYVIGLGDRHLDNILLDLSTGQVIHIDYNVCFEKGKTLRVPERVPFRLTPNFETAMGLTGVEGPFRMGCEHVMRTVRNGKDTLLELLEAFVYDPLVDWTHLGAENLCEASLLLYGTGKNLKDAAAMQESALARRREMTRALTRQMFALRLAEMRAEWLANRDDLEAAIPELAGALEATAAAEEELAAVEQRMREGHEALVVLKEAESSQRHPLQTLGERYARHVVHQTATSVAVAAVQKALREYRGFFAKRERAFGQLLGTQLHLWFDESEKLSTYLMAPRAYFSVVRDFLGQVGKAKLYEECEVAERDLKEAVNSLMTTASSTLELLRQYASIAGMYPSHPEIKSPLAFYDKCLKKLVNNFTLQTCHEVASEYEGRRAAMIPGNEAADEAIVPVVHAACLTQKLLRELRQKHNEIKQAHAMQLAVIAANAHETEMAMIGFLNWVTTVPVAEDPAEVANTTSKRRIAAMEAVILSVLAGLCKQLLGMETAVARSNQLPTSWSQFQMPSTISEDMTHMTASSWFLLSSSIDGLARVLAWSPGDANLHGVSSGPAEFSSDNSSIFNRFSRSAAHCVLKIRPIYSRLQDLAVSTEHLILPETVSLLLAGNPSMLGAIEALQTIMLRALGQDHPGRSSGLYTLTLKPLIDEMELYLHYLMIGMEPDNVSNTVITERLINEYWSLLNSNAESTDSQTVGTSEGIRLLNAFNGLFKSLEDALHDLLMTFASFDLPERSKDVDLAAQAAGLIGPVLNPVTLKTLSDIFLLKRIQSIYEFFVLNQQICQMWRGVPAPPVLLHVVSNLGIEDLVAPVRRYCGEFFNRLVLGVPSQVLSQMITYVLEHSAGVDVADEAAALRRSSFDSEDPASVKVDLDSLCRSVCAQMFPGSQSDLVGATANGRDLANLSGLISQYDTVFVRADKVRGLHAEQTGVTAGLERWELIASSQFWFEEESLKLAPYVASIGPEMAGIAATQDFFGGRSAFMEELGRFGATLNLDAEYVLEKKSMAVRLVESVKQRLRWAVGANPEIRDLVDDFERRVSLMQVSVDSALSLAGCLASTSEVVYQDELFRHAEPGCYMAESGSGRFGIVAGKDMEFLGLLKTCSDACSLVEKFDNEHGSAGAHEGGDSSVSPLEEKLVAFMAIGPEGVTDAWISEVSDKVRDDIGQVQTKIGEVKAEVASKKELVIGKARKVRGLFAHHRQLFHSVKPMLKTMAKWKDEYAGGITAYLRRHMDFCANCHGAVTFLISDVPKEAKSLEAIHPLLKSISENLTGIYEDLWSLTAPQSRSGLRMLETGPERQESERDIRREPKRGNSVSFIYHGVEPNLHALKVWRRVRAKLEGKDTETMREPLSVQQHVESLIREARDLDNLAVLYEGWTPWV